MSRATLGASLPPEPADRFYNVISPKGADRLKVTLLADTFFGAWVHWDGHPLPCANNEHCVHCALNKPHRWQGYIAVINWSDRKRAVLALSEGAARQLLLLLDRYQSLRGIQLQLHRKHASKNNSPVVVTMTGRVSGDDLVEEHPIHDSLSRLFGINLLKSERRATEKPAHEPFNEREGVALPYREEDDSASKPTREQLDRLKSILGGFGRME